MSSIIFLFSKIKTLKTSLTVKYYNIDEIQNLNNLNHKDTLSPFHINTCFLLKNIEELQYLFDKTKINFDVIGMSESRIKKDKSHVNSINLKGYSYECCTTEYALVYKFVGLQEI